MALTIAQKSAVRRHLGYPVIGLLRNSPGGGTLGAAAAGYRFHQVYGFLEYKLNNLNPDEEARLTGLAFGSVALVGPQPLAGDAITVTFSGGPLVSPVPVTVTLGSPAPAGDNRITLMNALAGAISLNAGLQAAGFIAAAPYGTGPFSENAVAIAECAFTNPQQFTLACTGTGAMAPQVTSNGALLSPSAIINQDGTTVTWGYTPILDFLENAYGGTSQNLDTQKADVWSGRSNELGQRQALYETWVDKTVNFLGIPRNVRRGTQPGMRRASQYA